MFGIDDAIVAAGVTALGSMAGAGITAASQHAPSSTTHQAKLNLKYGKLYDEWSAKNMPSLNREGYERAGYNPILAFQSGGTGHGMGSVSGSPAYNSIGDVDFGSSLSSAISAYYDIKQRNAALDNAKAQTNLVNANAAKAWREFMLPPKLSSAQQVERLMRYATKHGVWKQLGEALQSPNNITINNRNDSVTSAKQFMESPGKALRMEMNNIKPSDFNLRFNPSDIRDF